MKIDKVLNQEDIFHVFDHDKEESFFIVGKSNFMRWLNDFADNEKYTFFSTQEKLQAYLSRG